jgi:hypothetical protein
MRRVITERENREKIASLLMQVPEIAYSAIAREADASRITVIRIAAKLGIKRKWGRKKGR